VGGASVLTLTTATGSVYAMACGGACTGAGATVATGAGCGCGTGTT